MMFPATFSQVNHNKSKQEPAARVGGSYVVPTDGAEEVTVGRVTAAAAPHNLWGSVTCAG